MRIAKQGNFRRTGLLAALVAIALLGLGSAQASAAVEWEATSSANTTVAPGDGDPNTAELTYYLQPKNVGDTAADAEAQPIVFNGTLPPGITVQAVQSGGFGPSLECPSLSVGDSTFSCQQTTGSIGAQESTFVAVKASVASAASGVLTALFELSGGTAPSPGKTADPTWISATPPQFGVEAFDFSFAANPAGGAFTQAGGHPYDFLTTVVFNTHTDPDPYYGEVTPVEPIRDAYVELPPGLVGNPTAAEQCTLLELSNGDSPIDVRPLCPTDSQVGKVTLRWLFGLPELTGPLGVATLRGSVPLFNMDPPPGAAARFGFQILGVPVLFDAKLRSSDYGLDVTFEEISEGLTVVSSEVELWGVPGDPSHDAERACPGQLNPGTFLFGAGGPTCKAGSPPEPFLRMPTTCTPPGQGLPFRGRFDSWENPGATGSDGLPVTGDPRWKSASVVSHEAPGYPFSPEDPTTPWGAPQGTTGCADVPVKGSLSAKTTALDAETSSGLSVHVEVPNPGLENPTGIASSDIKGVKLTLPQGLTINPSQAEGLGVCSAAQYASTELSFHPTAKGCPSDSKVGTVAVKTPLLNEVLPGSVYVAKPQDNPFDSLLAIYVVIEEPQRGILIKLPGEIRTNEQTGRIEAEFSDLPQTPFSTFDFHFREGARAPLITPPTCGTYESEAVFTPWSDPSKKLISRSSFQITRGIGGGPCPPNGTPAFNPGFSAGSVNNNAASFSPFLMRLTRQDGEQNMTRFDAVLPPGVLGKLAGIAKCPEAAIAAAKAKSGAEERANPSCPANSEIGHSIVGAGVGSVLTYIPGKLYLGGPVNGRPLSVISITPALAGPFDVGTVVVREALTLNPVTAEVEVDGGASDPIPHILKGIPAKIRDLRIYVDRPNFILNPTSCDPSSAKATLFGSAADVFSSADDIPVALSDRYQAANCLNLGFKPKLRLNLKGGTRRGDFPGLKATLKARGGDANIARAEVTLPKSAFLEQGHLKNICTRVQFAANNCPKASIYGHAKAITPLLDQPIEGPVLLRSSNHKLPDLVIALKGLVDVNVASRIDSVDGGLRSTFEAVPDAPISRFVLRMKGGKKGLIVNSRNLCRGKNRAQVAFTGHNGRVANLRPELKPRCGKARKGRKK